MVYLHPTRRSYSPTSLPKKESCKIGMASKTLYYMSYFYILRSSPTTRGIISSVNFIKSFTLDVSCGVISKRRFKESKRLEILYFSYILSFRSLPYSGKLLSFIPVNKRYIELCKTLFPLRFNLSLKFRPELVYRFYNDVKINSNVEC